MSERLLIVSPCYSCEDGAGMVATAKLQGLDPELTDVNVRSDCHQGNNQFYNLMPLLEARTEKYVACCDCVDVAWLAGEEEIMAKFFSFNSGMVVSAEKDQLAGMGETGTILDKYPGFFKNLNIGLWIGERTYAIHVLRESYRLYFDRPAIANYKYNSPQAWMNLMLAGGDGPEFALDRNCVLFQSMNLGSPDDVAIEGKRVRNKTTGTYPCALHYNGDKSLKSYRAMVERLLAE